MQEMVLLSRIELDHRMQHRADEDNEEAVKDYMAKDGKMPPVEIIRCGQYYYLWDGFKRFEARHRLGKKDILANVEHGSWDTAMNLSFGANGGHGCRRTGADKRKAIRDCDAYHLERDGKVLSSRDVADMCDVSHDLVCTVRNEIKALSESDKPKPTKAGKSAPAPAPKQKAPEPMEGPKASVIARTSAAVETARHGFFALGGYDLFRSELLEMKEWLDRETG